MPNWRLASALMELSENLATGRSSWGRVILALRSHGFSTDKLSSVIKVKRQTLLQLEGDPAVIPEHRTGEALLALYRRHVKVSVGWPG